MERLISMVKYFKNEGHDIVKISYDEKNKKAWLYSSNAPLATPETDVIHVTLEDVKAVARVNKIKVEVE